MTLRNGVVGFGPATIALLEGLVHGTEQGVLGTDVKLTIFEKNDKIAVGTPYDPAMNHPNARVNISSYEEGISAESPRGYWEWLQKQSKASLERMQVPYTVDADGVTQVSQDGCFSRTLSVGVYLREYADDMMDRLKVQGVKIDVKTNTEATDYVENPDGTKTITTKSKGGIVETHEFDQVNLHLGHWYKKDPAPVAGQPREYNSPWPVSKLGVIAPGEKVGVIGTGPSGVDAALAIAEVHGSFMRVNGEKLRYFPKDPQNPIDLTMLSKSGHLPEARGPIDQEEYYDGEEFSSRINEKGFLPLDSMFEIFRNDMKARYPEFAATIPNLDTMTFVEFAKWAEKEMDARGDGATAFKYSIQQADRANATGKPLPMQDVLINLYVFSNEHRQLSAEDKVVFNKFVKPILGKYNAPLPIEISEQMEALIDAGVLKIEKATIGPGSDALKKFTTVVNSTGQSHNLADHPAELVQKMVAKGYISSQLIEFANGDKAEQLATALGQSADKVVRRDGKAYLALGGVNTDEDGTLVSADGSRIEGTRYVGPNDVKIYDAYALIMSRDNHNEFTEGEDFIATWNAKAGLPKAGSKPAPDSAPA